MIKYDDSAKLYAVIDYDGYTLECFPTEQQAIAYLAEFEAARPKTAGQIYDLAEKHGALFR